MHVMGLFSARHRSRFCGGDGETDGLRAGPLRPGWGQGYGLGTLGIPLLGLQEGEPKRVVNRQEKAAVLGGLPALTGDQAP